MAKKIYQKKRSSDLKIAKERIKKLFDQAEKEFDKRPALSNRYVTIARKIAMKFKVRIPKELKRRYCKNCYKYLVPGKNCRVRTQRGKVVYYCFNCKRYTRIAYK